MHVSSLPLLPVATGSAIKKPWSLVKNSSSPQTSPAPAFSAAPRTLAYQEKSHTVLLSSAKPSAKKPNVPVFIEQALWHDFFLKLSMQTLNKPLLWRDWPLALRQHLKACLGDFLDEDVFTQIPVHFDLTEKVRAYTQDSVIHLHVSLALEDNLALLLESIIHEWIHILQQQPRYQPISHARKPVMSLAQKQQAEQESQILTQTLLMSATPMSMDVIWQVKESAVLSFETNEHMLITELGVPSSFTLRRLAHQIEQDISKTRITLLDKQQRRYRNPALSSFQLDAGQNIKQPLKIANDITAPSVPSDADLSGIHAAQKLAQYTQAMGAHIRQLYQLLTEYQMALAEEDAYYTPLWHQNGQFLGYFDLRQLNAVSEIDKKQLTRLPLLEERLQKVLAKQGLSHHYFVDGCLFDMQHLANIEIALEDERHMRALRLFLQVAPDEPLSVPLENGVRIPLGLAGAFFGDLFSEKHEHKKMTTQSITYADPAEINRLEEVAENSFNRAQKTYKSQGVFRVPSRQERMDEEVAFERATVDRSPFKARILRAQNKIKQIRKEAASYLELANENINHFAPYHREKWLEGQQVAVILARDYYHLQTQIQALEKAIAKEPNNDQKNKLTVQLLAAQKKQQQTHHDCLRYMVLPSHFLQDAFVAGHQVSRQLVSSELLLKQKDGSMGLKPVWRNKLKHELQKAILQDLEKVPKDSYLKLPLLNYEVSIAELSLHSDSAEQKALYVAEELLVILEKSKSIDSLIIKIIHDHLNQEGIDVMTGEGQRLRLYGDAYLIDTSRPCPYAQLHLVQRAAFQSMMEVVQTAHTGLGPHGKIPKDYQAFKKLPHTIFYERPVRMFEPPSPSPQEHPGFLADAFFSNQSIVTEYIQAAVSGPYFYQLIKSGVGVLPVKMKRFIKQRIR